MVTLNGIELAKKPATSACEQTAVLRSENPAIRRLLDAISSIIALDYARTVRQNPKVFMSQGGAN
jgi:hypothetical protein